MEIDIILGADNGLAAAHINEENVEENVEDVVLQQFSKRLFGGNLNSRYHGVVSFLLLSDVQCFGIKVYV